MLQIFIAEALRCLTRSNLILFHNQIGVDNIPNTNERGCVESKLQHVLVEKAEVFPSEGGDFISASANV